MGAFLYSFEILQSISFLHLKQTRDGAMSIDQIILPVMSALRRAVLTAGSTQETLPYPSLHNLYFFAGLVQPEEANILHQHRHNDGRIIKQW